jgi:hypothetical protein
MLLYAADTFTFVITLQRRNRFRNNFMPLVASRLLQEKPRLAVLQQGRTETIKPHSELSSDVMLRSAGKLIHPYPSTIFKTFAALRQSNRQTCSCHKISAPASRGDTVLTNKTGLRGGSVATIGTRISACAGVSSSSTKSIIEKAEAKLRVSHARG